jgi:hypothetical protein
MMIYIFIYDKHNNLDILLITTYQIQLTHTKQFEHLV